MHLFPPELEIGEYEGFSPEKDIFKRSAFGEGLGNLFGNVDDPMVAVLDAPWGSGKTTFVKMWCGYMRNRGFPVIYFDAFKNDYADDAFLALAGEVIALADELGPLDAAARKGFLGKAQKVAVAAVKGGIKKGIGKFIGEEGVAEVVAAAAEGGAGCALDSLDAYLLEKLEGRKKERDAFSEFGHALEILSGELSEAMNKRGKDAGASGDDGDAKQQLKRPLIFVIDELDRCKPPFALDILEKIKHFFSVTNVHFLLVTHMEQLENSVRFAYGLDRHAEMYLQKFYHAVFTFPSHNDKYETTDIGKYLRKIFEKLPIDDLDGDDTDDFKKIIAAFANQNNITFRSLERIVTQARIFLASTNKRQLWTPAIAATLCIIKATAPTLYKKAQAGTILFDEVLDYMKFQDSPSINHWSRAWWIFCVGDDNLLELHKPDMDKLKDYLIRYSVDDRKEIVPFICSLLDRLELKI